MPWNRIGKYEIRPERDDKGHTIYVIYNTETGQHENGHWYFIAAAMYQAAKMELEF